MFEPIRSLGAEAFRTAQHRRARPEERYEGQKAGQSGER
jgi:hypothetical protein